MNESRPKFIYLTLPETPNPILNVGLDGPGDPPLYRFALDREQLFKLNAQFAEAIWKGMAR